MTAAVALALPAVIFAILLLAPDAFSATWRGSRTPTINGILLAPIAAFFVVAFNASVLDLSFALLPAGVCAVIAVLLGLGAAARPMPGALWAAILFLAAYGGGYGFGGLVFADIRFDHGQPQVFQTAVLTHSTSYGRGGTSYHLTLAPFGPVTVPANVRVSSATYAALNPGDVACVTLRPGALKMAWYTTALCPAG